MIELKKIFSTILKYKSIMLLLFLFTYILFPLNTFANSIEKKNILLLHSYHPGMTWVKNINSAVEDVLKIEENDFVLYTEYMDTKRFNSETYLLRLKEVYKEKYHDKNIDIILSTDNYAFNFLIKNRNELFGKVPVVFSGVNGFEPSQIENITSFTGVAERFSVKETVDHILKIHPKIKQIYIVNDYLETGLAWKKDIKKALKGYQKNINLVYSKNISLDALKDKINSFDDETVVLMGVYFADKNKNYVTFERVGSYLLGESRAPVYCLLNFNISNNVIGGKVISGYSQGEAMSKVSLRILDGEKSDDIAITNSEANDFIFNYNGLKNYNIDNTLLPSESIIVNQPYSLYEEYTSILFLMIGIFVLGLFILVFFLIYQKRNQNMDEDNNEMMLISFIRYAPIVFIPFITLLIIWLLIYNANESHEHMLEHEKHNYIEQKKNEAKREVDRYINIVQIRLAMKSDIKEKIIHKNLLAIASKLKYDTSGYLMVSTMNGKLLLHPNPNFVGVDSLDGNHSKIRDVFLKFQDIVNKEGGGFVNYSWINPVSNKVEDKITYVRKLNELNWYIAAGVYLDEINRHIDKNVAENVRLDNKHLLSIAILSFVLLLISIATSIGLSILVKNVFYKYHQNIIAESEKNKEIEATKDKFEKLATVDSLTQVYNRFSIMNMMHTELEKMREKKGSLSFIMFDLDLFKNVNDNYGHDIGDSVLKEICRVVEEKLRGMDTIGRYGGEEFIIILPDTGLSLAKEISERLRQAVEFYEFYEVKKVTISLGVVEASLNEDKEELFKRLDSLLYHSKEYGRNMVSG